jgi:hypothetical protein
MKNRARCAFGVLLVALVAFPALRSPAADSFPLSTYPMFSLARPAETTVSSAAGFDAAGNRVTLSPRVVGGTAEVIQAAGTIGQAISSGSTEALCAEVLAKAPPAVVAVEIATETYDVVGYFDGDEEPIRRTVHARCES